MKKQACGKVKIAYRSNCKRKYPVSPIWIL